MDAAVHALFLRAGGARLPGVRESIAFSRERMLSSAVVGDRLVVLGAPEQVLARCRHAPQAAHDALDRLTGQGLRVLAVAARPWSGPGLSPADEQGLDLEALLGLEDPPRPDVRTALTRCREAEIKVAMLTGDHPRTAAAIAREVGLLRPDGLVVEGPRLPASDADLGELLQNSNGIVVARVTPGDKLRIARVLREVGHVVAMTGDGVNDVPALREADVGVAMGASGSDVTREAADLVLLDDHFATIVHAIELGRSTFANVRRFLTYHLTDNVAELAPFAVWAMTAGQVPLAITVLQVLALDIGTDMLPALALGTEPPEANVMRGPLRARSIVDRRLLARSFGVLGPVEAAGALTTFVVVLLLGGWSWGENPPADLLAHASGSTFAAIALAQMANAFACRSDSTVVWRLRPSSNLAVVWAVAAEAALLVAFLAVPSLGAVLGGSWPPAAGWAGAAVTAAALLLADSAHKHRLRDGGVDGRHRGPLRVLGGSAGTAGPDEGRTSSGPAVVRPFRCGRRRSTLGMSRQSGRATAEGDRNDRAADHAPMGRGDPHQRSRRADACPGRAEDPGSR
jgi:magnesium-transporting ATPase (P-type)